MIELEVDGVPFKQFTTASVTLAIDETANSFEFTATNKPENGAITFPFRRGDAVRVLVDGEHVTTGFIESMNGSYDATSHTIDVAGRDRTADYVDSGIDVIDDLQSGLSLKGLLEKVLAHIKSPIKVIDNVNPPKFNEAEDIVSPDVGEGCFEFCDKYIRKRQVLLTSDKDGNLVITNSEATRVDAAIQRIIGSRSNNVLSAQWTNSAVDRFNLYIFKGQLDPIPLEFISNPGIDGVVEQGGRVTDDEIREGRQMVEVLTKGYSSEQIGERAKWTKKIRRARSVIYSAQVRGFRDLAGNLYAINTVMPVRDDYADINRDLLVNSVTFSFSGAGSLTTLGFIEKNAYKIQISEPTPVGTDQDIFGGFAGGS